MMPAQPGGSGDDNTSEEATLARYKLIDTQDKLTKPPLWEQKMASFFSDMWWWMERSTLANIMRVKAESSRPKVFVYHTTPYSPTAHERESLAAVRRREKEHGGTPDAGVTE